MIIISYEKIDVTTKEKLDELYNSSALTFTGIVADDESLKQIIEWLKQYTEVSDPLPIHIIKGKTMNEHYNLTGSNSYQDNLTLVSIKTDDIKEVNKVAIPRFEMHGRWFDDIVDNNAIREKYKQGEMEEDVFE